MEGNGARVAASVLLADQQRGRRAGMAVFRKTEVGKNISRYVRRDHAAAFSFCCDSVKPLLDVPLRHDESKLKFTGLVSVDSQLRFPRDGLPSELVPSPQPTWKRIHEQKGASLRQARVFRGW